MTGIWQDLLVVGVPVAEKVVRTIAVYAFLIAGLRFFGKRELGQLNPLDFIVLLLLSNTVQNAIIGNDNSLLGGVLGAGVLFVVNDLLVRYSYRNPRVRRLIEGRAEELIRDGRIVRRALERNFITQEELIAAARKQGIEHMHDVECARLEVSGALSFTLHEPGAPELFHREVLARLAAIEKRLPAAVALLLFIALPTLGAQARPSTDVWVVPMRQGGGQVQFGEPKNATQRTGYDNQPGFTSDGKSVMYTRMVDNGPTDIWRFDLPSGTPKPVTATPQSEYSATATPDGRSFSVIRVELPDSTQRLWRFPLDGQGAPTLVLEKVKPVGYHVWAGEHTLVLFVLGSPATLQIADDRTGNSEVVARNIGRALAKVPGRDAVTFLQQVRDSASWITELNVLTKETKRLMQPPKGADYHVWTPGGALIAGSGSNLYVWNNGRWDLLADFARWGVRGISRLAVSPKGDWLAFVAEDQP
jgi:uncharacterized membrane protein YcaP (DUF421 family)